MPAPFIISVVTFAPNPEGGPDLRIVAVGEFQPDDGENPRDSFILYSWRAYLRGALAAYELTDKDKIALASTAVSRGREYLDKGTTGSQLARLGGQSTSEKKAAAARANGTRGGRPPKHKA